MPTTNTNKHWALQRKLLMNTRTGFNAEVYLHFRSTDPDGSAMSQSRLNLRDTLLINSKDSRTTATWKMDFFYFQVLKVQYKPTIIGQPKLDFDEKVAYKCQVELRFEQDKSALPKGERPTTAEIIFRLDETHLTITNTKISAIAAKIKSELVVAGKGWTWNKGKYIALYDDPERGYHLQIYALNATEGENVVKKILDIQNHPFNEKLLRITEPKRNSDNTPQSVTILGERVKLPKWRPSAKVRFVWADLHVWNLEESISLVDLSGRRRRRKSRTL